MVNTNDKRNNQSPIVNSNQLKNSNDSKNNSDTSSTSPSSSSLITSKPTPTNFAQNAAGPPKLIPIQSVLKTESQHSKQRQHQHSTKENQAQPSILQPTQLSTSSLLHSAAVPPIQQFISNSSSLPTELPQEDEERLGKLFKQLDRDGNGRIDVHDLSEALREFGLSSVYAEV